MIKIPRLCVGDVMGSRVVKEEADTTRDELTVKREQQQIAKLSDLC